MLTVYKASAGSGKTFTLAKTYITQLLGVKLHDESASPNHGAAFVLNCDYNVAEGVKLKESNRHRNILAITFTRKATAEMKRRILDELHNLSVVQPDGKIHSPYADDLLKLFNLHPNYHCTSKQLAEVAKLSLQQMLFDYHNFHVSTIDSFFQQVLRTFARELDFNSNYNVEMNDESALKNAVGIMLDEFNSSDGKNAHSTAIYSHELQPLEDWLYQYMLTLIDQGVKSNFFQRKSSAHTTLIELLKEISREDFKTYKDEMENYLQSGNLDAFEKKIKEYTAHIEKAATDTARKKAKDAGLDPAMLKYKPKKILEDLLEKPDYIVTRKIILGAADSAYAQKLFLNQEGSVVTAKTPKQYDAIAKDVFGTLYNELLPLGSLNVFLATLPQLKLLAYTWNYLKEYLHENNLLLISDSNDLVKKIIGEDDTPFVYERMGVELRHFLIDEFQDTSYLQWKNLCPLIDNALAQDDDSLVIGDEKQSIYRFRNSDSSILREKIYGDLSSHKIETRGSQVSENTNYRSSAEIVTFNNNLFSKLAEKYKLAEFGNVEQAIRPEYRDFHGYVRFKISNEKAEKEDVLNQLALEILRQHSDGKYDWKDIAVLVNTKNQAADVVNFLAIKHPEIPVLSNEALLLSSSPAVQLIISILKMVDQQLSTEKTKPKQLIIDNIEYALAKRLGNADTTDQIGASELTQLIQDVIKAASDPENDQFKGVVEQISTQRPASLVALVETIIGLQFTPEQRARQFTYLAALQDNVLNFSQCYEGGLHAFLEWWDEQSASLTINGASEADAVNVMTIHKSKGLEFHCVHIPFGNWPLYWDSRFSPKMWVPTRQLDIPQELAPLAPPAVFVRIDKNISDPTHSLHCLYVEERKKALSDCMNKTYVAYTRPRSELTVWAERREGKEDIIAPILDVLGLTPEEDSLEIGMPTHKTLTQQKAHSESIDLPDPYPVVQRSDSASNIQLDDVLALDDDIDDDTAANAIQAPEPIGEWLDESARQQGLILHDIMSNIYTLDDLHPAIERICARQKIPQELKEHFYTILARFLNPDKKNVTHWFGQNKHVYIEQPIYIPQSQSVRRPDRIVTYADGTADILDYKFTDNPANVGCDHHKKQLTSYMWYVKKLGYSQVRGYLCYPALDQIVKI